jgi:hypothetical protein
MIWFKLFRWMLQGRREAREWECNADAAEKLGEARVKVLQATLDSLRCGLSVAHELRLEAERERDKLLKRSAELSEIAELATDHGWDGVNNSKMLKSYLADHICPVSRTELINALERARVLAECYADEQDSPQAFRDNNDNYFSILDALEAMKQNDHL